jgi:hypothetical protein
MVRAWLAAIAVLVNPLAGAWVPPCAPSPAGDECCVTSPGGAAVACCAGCECGPVDAPKDPPLPPDLQSVPQRVHPAWLGADPALRDVSACVAPLQPARTIILDRRAHVGQSPHAALCVWLI